MNVRVLSYRTRTRATVWLWDWFGTFLVAVVAVLAGLALRTQGALTWWIALALFAACLITQRIHISRDAPGTGVQTSFWLFVPVRRRRFDLKGLASAHSDDWSGGPDDPHDELSSGDWSLSCHDASTVAEWLVTASKELALPRADRPAAR